METDISVYQARVDRVRSALAGDGLHALVVFDPLNVRYLTGFTGGEGLLVVRPDEVLLVSDFRYRLQAAKQAEGSRFVELEGPLHETLPGLVSGLDGPVGVEPTHLTVQQWERLKGALDGIEHSFSSGLVERLRMVKEPDEVRAVKAACDLAVATLDHLAQMHVVGRTEAEVALDLETWARRQGSEAVPFSYIVAAGPHGAMPHAEASRSVIGPNLLLVVDMGARVDGYASDITRTYATGPLSDEERGIHSLVLDAQAAARAAAAPGLACADLDAVARDLITAAGRGEQFGHGLGHGVGLDVHEEPRVGSRSTDVLETGMVVTIEPGVYVPGLGGVRIEDTVVVTEAGIEVLTECERGPTALC